MNIGLSTSVLERGKSGIAQYILALGRAFAKFGQHRFFFFTLQEDLPLLEFAREYAEVVAVPERFRPPLRNLFWHQTALPRLLEQKGIAVVHVPSYRRMIWSCGCARVVTIHDLAPCVMSGKYGWGRTVFAKQVARQLSRRQQAIISISHATAGEIVRCYQVPLSRLHVIHNGIDHKRFCPGPVESARCWARERFKLRAPFFLYVGRLEHPGKNHVRLIEAFNRFKAASRSPWKLALAGSDWQQASVIHAKAAGSPFARDISFLGFVPDMELPLLYRAASVFVYPSLYEGFGLPPLEAMACGCPVIASARGALGEVLGCAAQMIDPENINEMAAGLGSMAADESIRTRWRNEGLSHVRQFDWEKTAAATIKVYGQACR